eukprot:7089486-Prymnesium_polylepis.1
MQVYVNAWSGKFRSEDCAARDEPCERRAPLRAAAARPLQPCARWCLRLQPPPWPEAQRSSQLAQELSCTAARDAPSRVTGRPSSTEQRAQRRGGGAVVGGDTGSAVP